MSTDLGPWAPLPLADAVRLFQPARCRWWITGGHALELFTGRSWRTHDDTDVGVVREDLGEVRRLLAGWDLHVAAAGTLSPWDGSPLQEAPSQNNLWCRQAPGEPWCLDVTVSSGDDTSWISRRDPSLRVPWSQAVLNSDARVPYLAPELQLLFKAKANRPKDDVDAAQVIPLLDAPRRRFLSSSLPAEHPWHQLLARS